MFILLLTSIVVCLGVHSSIQPMETLELFEACCYTKDFKQKQDHLNQLALGKLDQVMHSKKKALLVFLAHYRDPSSSLYCIPKELVREFISDDAKTTPIQFVRELTLNTEPSARKDLFDRLERKEPYRKIIQNAFKSFQFKDGSRPSVEYKCLLFRIWCGAPLKCSQWWSEILSKLGCVGVSLKEQRSLMSFSQFGTIANRFFEHEIHSVKFFYCGIESEWKSPDVSPPLTWSVLYQELGKYYTREALEKIKKENGSNEKVNEILNNILAHTPAPFIELTTEEKKNILNSLL